MELIEIVDEKSLSDWLTDKPPDWAQVIALRAALLVLPEIGYCGEPWLTKFALLPFGALLTSWVQLVDNAIFVCDDESRANARFGGEAFDFDGYRSEPVAAHVADSSYHSADAQSKSIHVFSDCISAVTQAAAVYRTRYNDLKASGHYPARPEGTLWENVTADCQRLLHLAGATKAKSLAIEPLWDEKLSFWADPGFHRTFDEKLLSIDPNYAAWIDWYERRNRGERAAFDIPGDKRRVEDKNPPPPRRGH